MGAIPETPTLFFYAGGEDVRYLELLLSAGVKRFVLNYGTLVKLGDKRVEHMFMRIHANGGEFLVDPAIGTLVKDVMDIDENPISRSTFARIGEYADKYVAWVKKWRDYVDYALNLDFDPVFIRPRNFAYDDIPVEQADGALTKPRHDLIKVWDEQLIDTGVKIIKVWHQWRDLKEVDMLRDFHSIALRNINNKATLRLLMNQAAMLEVKIHAIGMNRTEWLERMGFHAANNASWLSGKMYGATYVFDGRNLIAYHKHQQTDCRKRHADHFKRLGYSVEKVQANDVMEVCKVNLRAWVDFEKHLQKTSVGAIIAPPKPPELAPMFDAEDAVWDDTIPEDITPGLDENEEVVSQPVKTNNDGGFQQTVDMPEPTTLDGFLSPISDSETQPVSAEPRTEAVSLPTHKQQMMKGNDNAVRNPTGMSSLLSAVPMQCDGCFAARQCPKFKAGATCAYRKEFESIDTRDVFATLDAMQDLAAAQKSRLMRALMYENVANGGMISKDVGAEIDRMTKLLEVIGRLRKEVSTITVGINKNGIFAQIFGPGVIDPKIIEPSEEAEEAFIDVELDE